MQNRMNQIKLLDKYYLLKKIDDNSEKHKPAEFDILMANLHTQIFK